ncbi:MAG: hypothetical protein ACPGVD_08490 [Flavobacteriales bacterium]
MHIPKIYHGFREYWYKNQLVLCNLYESHQYSFIPNLLPEQAIHLSTQQVFGILQKRLGKKLHEALEFRYTIDSPIKEQKNGNWLKVTNMVGINVRTIGNFWNIIKYVLTIPDSQQSIHILPIWEPGVVSSLYGISSWNINPEFYSYELQKVLPQLDTVEKQLKVVINLLHAMGKSVGMDVIPHTDRYSEIVISNPHHFEWLQRENMEIVDYQSNLHEQIQTTILNFVKMFGSAINQDYPRDLNAFFYQFPEEDRNLILFGMPNDLEGRTKRRNQIITYLYSYGYESVPATMAPPYRGLVVDTNEEAKIIDDDGRIWRDYKIAAPEPMSRVFGPLTRFKLYARLENNENWKIDFDEPRIDTWKYVCQKYYEIQAEYNFDFMRGDMSHVQMRSNGVLKKPTLYYDILQSIKNHVQKTKPYFGYFAETFLAPTGAMAYGDEVDHLEISEANTTLGDLQSLPVGTPEFLQRFRHYLDILNTRNFAPNFTMMTADKDDPRFDKFYLKGNVARFFIGLFLGDMPSYMGLGFECRDIHYQPAPNEHYTKLYVFQIDKGGKRTKGAYQWGKNGGLYHQITKLKFYGEKIVPIINGRLTQWLLSPDATGYNKVIAWTQIRNPQYVFIVNLDDDKGLENLKLPKIKNIETGQLAFDFSTNSNASKVDLIFNGINWQVGKLRKGECKVYKFT